LEPALASREKNKGYLAQLLPDVAHDTPGFEKCMQMVLIISSTLSVQKRISLAVLK
jgi:hypothetical protein